MGWPAIIAALGGLLGSGAAAGGAAGGAAGSLGGLGGITSLAGGLMGMGANPDAPGAVAGGGAGGGLLMDMGQGGSSEQEGASFLDKLMMGEGKDMSGYGQVGDMSQFASISKLLAMANQMDRGSQQRTQRAPVAPYMHPAVKGLLGG